MVSCNIGIFIATLPEVPETVMGRGEANARGAPGLEYSLGIRGQNSKHLKNTVMTLLLLRYVTDTNMHIQ